MDIVQLLFLRHRHTSYSLTSILLVEKTTIANHQQLDARISTIEECLQTTTRHTCYADILYVKLLIIGRFGVCILSNSPINALNLLLRTRHRTFIPLVNHRDITSCEYDETVRGNLIEEVHVLPRRVGTSTIAPNQDGQGILSIKL